MRDGAMRAGEELDVAAVDAWLKARVPALAGSPEVTQYSGGASNWTYRLRYANGDLVLRRPPAGTKARSAHDMGREYRIQRALRPVFPYVPEMIAYCDDVGVIGAEFYVMERLDGIIPRRNFPPAVKLSPEDARAVCRSMLDALIALHRVDYEAAGLASIGKGAGYARRQIEGWSERYRAARTWNVPRAESVMRWLAGRIPAHETACLIHNDFRFDNLVLAPADPSRIIGILDWEMATLGDPLMDLGNSLAYWVEERDDVFAQATRRQPTHLPGMLTRENVVGYYRERTGVRIDDWSFYEVYGLFRLAAIAQQIYYRYFHRQTRNPAFRNYWVFVNYLVWRCRKVMKRAG